MNQKRINIVQPSTKEFIKEARQIPGYRLFDFLHGYVYARWPYLYISLGKEEHRLSPALAKISNTINRLLLPLLNPNGSGNNSRQTFAETYHGKVVPLEAAKQLVSVQEDVRIENLEQIIPYGQARDIVLKNPDHIVALECPCRAAKAGACQPTDVCLIVGEPFASFVKEHHPSRSRWIDSEGAVEILRAEEERGHVHHAFFKDAMFGRFYAICNCCACCCGAMGANRRGTPMLASSGYVSMVDEDLCIGCGDCNDYCQFFALSVNNGYATIDQSICMGCGVCVTHCPQDALTLIHDPTKGEPLEIMKLLSSAANN
ncbi:MAG: 4Fe-4S binding protein [Chloroflexota bacterium]|nr:MAG: 4Fe-4S binding protein [Chloroflexota bacterium]